MVVKQEDKLELIFKHFLVEDKSNNGGLLRGLPVSHAQGDSSAPELGASGPPPSPPLALYSEAL